MVVLDLGVSESEMRESRSGLAMADAAVIQATFFVLPVRLVVEGVDLLALPGAGPWLDLPVLDLATVGLEQIKKACGGIASVYALPGVGHHLHLEPTDGGVRITSTINRRSASTRCDEIVDAFEAFANRIRVVLKRDAPEILKVEEWRKRIEG